MNPDSHWWNVLATSDERSGQMPWIMMIKGKTPGKIFPLNTESVTLGRDPSCEIVVDDILVSKRHAKISWETDGYFLEDLLSKNGTKVGDEKCTNPKGLTDGDTIELGDTQFIFNESGSTILGVRSMSGKLDGQNVLARQQEKFHAILEIVKALGGSIDLEGILSRILEALMRILPQADRGFILLKEGKSEDLTLKASISRNPDSTAPVFSRTIFNHVTSHREAILIEDLIDDEILANSPSAMESQFRRIMCVPLGGRESLSFGVLQIDAMNDRRRFNENDLELMVAIAGSINVVIENARLHEIALKQVDLERQAKDARAVQQAMVPREDPNPPGYDFWHFYEAAASVGGDYFDYQPIFKSDRPNSETPMDWVVAIGDVSGKGMSAALMMARLSSEVRLLLQTVRDPIRVMERLNQDLCSGRGDERFITLVLTMLDVEKHEITVVNAGHMGPIIRRADGTIEIIGQDKSGLPLGIIANQTYAPVTATIEPGDVVVLYTDGVNEAMSSSLKAFGSQRLRDIIAGAGPDACQMGESILHALRGHTAGWVQSDDITLLVFKRNAAQ
jgi:sigma-B regulation protein RsbU (phosphoserine phosphatase)